MSDSTGSQTPLQEAVSIISITSILISVGCYVGALNKVPVITEALWWVACRAYEFFPTLARLPGAQMPILAASATVGIAFFVSTIPLSYSLASVFARAGYSGMERQTTNVKTTKGIMTISRSVKKHNQFNRKTLRRKKEEKWKQMEHIGNKMAVLLPIVSIASFLNPQGLGKKPEF